MFWGLGKLERMTTIDLNLQTFILEKGGNKISAREWKEKKDVVSGLGLQMLKCSHNPWKWSKGGDTLEFDTWGIVGTIHVKSHELVCANF